MNENANRYDSGDLWYSALSIQGKSTAMATHNDQTGNSFPRSTGFAIAATGFFISTAATLGSAMGHPYANSQIGMGVLLFAFGTAMIALAFRERRRERETSDI